MTQTAIDDLRLRVAEAFAEVHVTGEAEDMRSALLARISNADVESRVGFVAHAGQLSNGELQVQFNVAGDGWSSRWPAWAYQSAIDALLHGRKLWVISKGTPYGSNLLFVLVMAAPA